jgi:hypothetical protein
MPERIVLAVALAALVASSHADVVNLQCTGFPRKNSYQMLGNNVAVDTARRMVSTLDSDYQWISAEVSEQKIEWSSRHSSGGESIMYVFSLDRATLDLWQTVAANNRAVYTGKGQCQIIQRPQNKL